MTCSDRSGAGKRTRQAAHLPGAVVALLVALFPCRPLCAAEPEQVRPATGTLAQLRRVSNDVAVTVGDNLDKSHDWLYRRLQRLLVSVDARYSDNEQAPLVVPLSSLRIGFDGELLQKRSGLMVAGRPDLEATLRLPNIERRYRLFVSSSDLREAPVDPALASNPVRAGVRFVQHSEYSFDIGMRVKLKPQAYVALRWNTELHAGSMRLYPFVKPYVESGIGAGVSAGIAAERWRGQWIIRSASFADWRRNMAATRWSQTFLMGHAQAVIQERRYDQLSAGHDLACGTVATLTASGDHLNGVTAWEAGVLFKRPLRGGWLYGYVEPVVRMERASDWHRDVGVRIGFDALFWGLASRPADILSHCN
jgi:hypothetical protein